MLCEGHTEVYQDTIQYAYEEGKAKETIDFQYKNAADETSAQLKRQLRSRGIKDLKDIDRIDFIIGADHGKGAFIVGAKIVVTLKQDSIHESFSFEISIAEIICRKDTAAVLKATIHDELTKGLKTIADNNINITLNDNNEIECCFSTQHVNEPATSLKATMYVVGDLAFYAMVLGKEGMSGNWCHLCMLNAKEFEDLAKDGDEYTYALMKQFADHYKTELTKEKATAPKAQFGMKDDPSWPFIPLSHFIVPLLHCLIGIGDDIFSKFRDIVSEKIEYLSREELATRNSAGAIECSIFELVLERITFDKSADGKKLASEKAKVTRAKKKLKELGAISSVPGVATTVANSPNQNFLAEVMDFINTPEEVPVVEDEHEDGEEENNNNEEATTSAAATASTPSTTTATTATNNTALPSSPGAAETDVQQTINKVEKIISDSTNIINPLSKKRAKITSRLKTARTYLKKLKDSIVVFKSDRKKSGDGIESQMFSVLKVQFGVKMQAYHGGTMTGKDIQKVMCNAREIFTLFANILKANKKEGCKITEDGNVDDDIDNLCNSFADLCVLWDGAFSYASTINPTEQDIEMYTRFVTAAVHSHKVLGLSITPKVHMMWKHTKVQMKFPGGLGQKREDWVEHQHQITSRDREQYSKTKDREVRALSMARSRQQYTNPDVEQYEREVNASVSRGPRENYTKKEAERKVLRDEARLEALLKWECVNK